MSELVKKVIAEIGKFELGLNDSNQFMGQNRLPSSQNAVDLLIRYGSLAYEGYALVTTPDRNALQTAEIIAFLESVKVGVHYFIIGMNRWNKSIIKYKRRMQENERPIVLNLSRY